MDTTLPPAVRALYPFASNFYEAREGRIHYLDEGTGPVVVMVHGNPTWSFLYRDLIRELRADHRCIAIDHLGCGLSDKPASGTYRLEAHLANLAGLLDHLGVTRFSLVVHDWGGPIGLGACAAMGVVPFLLESLDRVGLERLIRLDVSAALRPVAKETRRVQFSRSSQGDRVLRQRRGDVARDRV